MPNVKKNANGRLPSENVDDEEADGERDERGTGREDHVRAGPEVLVDRERPSPQEARRGRDRPPGEEARDLLPDRRGSLQEEARERPREHRRDRGERRDDPFRIPTLRVLPEMALQHGKVDGALHVPLRREVETRAEEDPRVDGDENDGDRRDPHGATPPDGEDDPRSEDEDDADARQDAWDSEAPKALEKRDERIERHQPAHDDDRHPAPEGVAREIAAVRALFHTLFEREHARDTHDEQEPREDEVGRRPSVPLRVVERPVEMRPVARVVDEDHSHDRQAAKEVEGREAPAALAGGGRRHRGGGRRREILLACDSDMLEREAGGAARLQRCIS